MSALKEADKILTQVRKLEAKRIALLAAAKPEVRELVSLALKQAQQPQEQEAAE